MVDMDFKRIQAMRINSILKGLSLSELNLVMAEASQQFLAEREVGSGDWADCLENAVDLWIEGRLT